MADELQTEVGWRLEARSIALSHDWKYRGRYNEHKREQLYLMVQYVVRL